MGNLHSIDIIILIMYFVSMIGISVYYYKKIDDAESFAVADRSLSMRIMVGTTVATCIGASTTFGQVGMVNRLGVAGLYSIIGWHIGWLALIVMSKPLRRSGASSLPEFVEIKFGKRAKSFAGIISLVFLVNATAAQVASLGTVAEALALTTYKTGAIIGGIIVIVYTIFGGLYAVSVTDSLQAVILFLGVGIATPFIAYREAGGVSYVFNNLGPDVLNWTDFNIQELLPLTLGFVLAAGSHAAYSQRIFASKDENVAFKGSIISNVLALVIQLLIALTALTIPFIFPNMVNGEMLVPTIISTYMPPVLKGFVSASLIGVVVSTADSFLLLLGTTFTNDIAYMVKPSIPKDKLLTISRISTLVGGFICIILGLYGGSVLKLFATGASAYGAGMFFPLLLGCFWKDTSSRGVEVGMLTGTFTTIIWNLTLKSVTGIDGVLVGASLCLISIVLISLNDKNKRLENEVV